MIQQEAASKEDGGGSSSFSSDPAAAADGAHPQQQQPTTRQPNKRLLLTVGLVIIVAIAVITGAILGSKSGNAEQQGAGERNGIISNDESSSSNVPAQQNQTTPSTPSAAAPTTSNSPPVSAANTTTMAPTTAAHGLLASQTNDDDDDKRTNVPSPSSSPTTDVHGLLASQSTPVPSSVTTAAATTTPVASGGPISADSFFVPPNPVPDNPDGSYFNYDPDDADHGVDAWRYVDTSDNYLVEFGVENGFGPYKGQITRDPATNRCSYEGQMSPLDLYQKDGEESQCDADHQIRTRAGSYRLDQVNMEKRIEPNKLRLVMNRRSCLGVERNAEGRTEYDCTDNPPMADYPTYSSDGTHFSDMLNLDIKVPGEHWIEGESFDAEIQMLHTHPTSQRLTSIGVPVRATADGFNAEFQAVLDQFQLVYDWDQAQCAATTVPNRRRAASQFFRSSKGQMTPVEEEEDNNNNNNYSTPLDDPDLHRRLQERAPRFDPYTSAFFTTLYFFRYNGSTTEPPCHPLTWFVLSSPMLISLEQLRQIKVLIFTHVNGQCEPTSVHNAQQSVARPLQSIAEDRFLMQCVPGDFVPDAERGTNSTNDN